MQKKSKSWKDLSTGERKAVLVGWAAILAIGAYFLWPSNPTETVQEAPPHEIAVVTAPTITYAKASPEALVSANQYFADIEKAMSLGVEILKSQNVTSVGEHSRRFSALADQGKELFGATIADPLGYCGMAGTFARTWWQTQVGAAMKGGVEVTPDEIQTDFNLYQSKRKDCLSTFTEGFETNG